MRHPIEYLWRAIGWGCGSLIVLLLAVGCLACLAVIAEIVKGWFV